MATGDSVPPAESASAAARTRVLERAEQSWLFPYAKPEEFPPLIFLMSLPFIPRQLGRKKVAIKAIIGTKTTYEEGD